MEPDKSLSCEPVADAKGAKFEIVTAYAPVNWKTKYNTYDNAAWPVDH